jgi:hypothetical protein
MHERGDDLTFKKDGHDPEYNPAPFIGLRWVGAIAAALGFVIDTNQQRVEAVRWSHGRSRGKPTPRKKKRNMRLVSKRVRRKHRRAA